MANNLKLPNYAVIDFETSGISQSDSTPSSKVVSMTQVAMILLDGDDLSELARYESYILPYDTKLEWQEKAEQITGITKDKLWEEGKDLKTVFKELSNILQEHKKSNILKSTVVGQNIAFDVDFLIDGYQRCGLDITKSFKCHNLWGTQVPRFIDVLDDGRLSNPKGKHTLFALCDLYGVDYIDGHDAMNDVMITADIFRAITQRLRSSSELIGEQTEVDDVRQTFEWM